MVIIAAVLIYLSRVKRQLKRQRRNQYLPQRIEKKQFNEWKREGASAGEFVQKTRTEKAEGKIESEEPEEPLLEFIR